MRFQAAHRGVAGSEAAARDVGHDAHRARPCIERRSEPPPLRAPAKCQKVDTRDAQNGGPKRSVIGPPGGGARPPRGPAGHLTTIATRLHAR